MKRTQQEQPSEEAVQTKKPRLEAEPGKRITLNVGGQRFETTRATLRRLPYLDNMLQDCGQETHQEEIFVDRSPALFDQVLQWARDPLHPFPLAYAYELDFYDAAYERAALHDPQQAVMQRLGEIQTGLYLVRGGILEAIHWARVNSTERCDKPNCNRLRRDHMNCSQHLGLCGAFKCTTPTEGNFCDAHIAEYDDNCQVKDCYHLPLKGHCVQHSTVWKTLGQTL